MKKRVFLVSGAILIILLSVSIIAIECGSVPTDNCDITQNTTFAQNNYFLPNGIRIGTSNIVLDCNGSVIQGSGVSNSRGITMSAYDYNKVENCHVINYTEGIYLTDNIGPEDPDFNIITGNILEYNTYGVHLYRDPESNNITLNTIQTNSYGIYLSGQYPNIPRYNNIWNNNFIDNVNQSYDLGSGNQWNISEVGNHWNNYDSESEGCFDLNSDLICDAPYNITGSAVSKDWFPLMGVQILSILPIQVVSDVDMVKDKTTLVRTTLKYTGSTNKNITIKLYFEGNLKDTEEDTLNVGQEKDIDFWFVPDVAGNNKEIEIVVEENGD